MNRRTRDGVGGSRPVAGSILAIGDHEIGDLVREGGRQLLMQSLQVGLVEIDSGPSVFALVPFAAGPGEVALQGLQLLRRCRGGWPR